MSEAQNEIEFPITEGCAPVTETAPPSCDTETGCAPASTDRVILRESPSQQPRVDRESHVVRNVKLLGRFSKNLHPVSGKPFRYTDKALKGFAALQEGARVHIDHLENPTDALDSVRGYGSQLGDARNVRAVLDGAGAGTYGDIHYNPAHPLAEQFVYDAEHAPHRLALSHVATGQGRENGDYHDVETAESVASVDIVTHGGTNVSLFEEDRSKITKMTQENLKLAERVESLEKELSDSRKREQRRAELEAAGVTASDKLFEVLVRSSDEDAAVLIESMRAEPVSRPAQDASDSIKSTDDFVALLGGN